jgi:hypothetical protein
MLDNIMPLEKIPAILLVEYGIHLSLTPLTPPTPKNERRMEDAPVEPNWFAHFLKVSNFAVSQTHQLTFIKAVSWMCTIIEICIIVGGTTKATWSKGVMALLMPNGKHPDCIKLTPTATFCDGAGAVGYRDPVLVLSRDGKIFHGPCHSPQKPQAHHDWALQCRSTPFLHRNGLDVYRAGDLVYSSRVMAEGEHDLSNEALLVAHRTSDAVHYIYRSHSCSAQNPGRGCDAEETFWKGLG